MTIQEHLQKMRLEIEVWLDLLFATVMIFMLMTMGFYTAQTDMLQKSILLGGSSINGIDVQGLDPSHAIDVVSDLEEARLLQAIHLVVEADGISQSFDAKDLGATTNAREALENLLEPLQRGSVGSRSLAYYRLRKGASCEIKVSYNRTKINQICKNFANGFARKPMDASMKLTLMGDAFDYIEDRPGVMIYHDVLADRMWKQLQEGNSNTLHEQVHVVAAAVTMEDLQDQTMVLASYETKIATRSPLLKELIEQLNGATLSVGQNFSLRSVLFPNKTMASKDQAVAGQIASTFYQATLLAGCDLVERTAHASPPAYIPMGLDAMLSDTSDLLMCNNSIFPMYVLAAQKGNILKIEIHGRLLPNDETMVVHAEVDRYEDADGVVKKLLTIEKQEGEPLSSYEIGRYFVSVYRNTIREKKVIAKELLTVDQYDLVSTP